MKKILKKAKLLFLSLIILSFFSFSLSCNNAKIKDDNLQYLSNSDDFIKAIQKGQKKIYIDDISFIESKEIILNYPIEIIGKSELSTIENASFSLNGSNVSGHSIDISLKNIVFDGKVNKNEIKNMLVEDNTFDEIFADYPQRHCINGSIGYFNLTIDNCEIKNYLCEEAPAIYINNDTNYRSGTKKINITNTKFYDNICESGTLKVFSDVLTTNINNCEFYGNLGKSAQGLVIGNGKSYISNTLIHDNEYFHFVYHMERKIPNIFHDDKKTFKGITTNALTNCFGTLFIGGSNATIDNCKIYNNKTVFGGGIGINNASTLENDEKIMISNTEIFNNEATRCGAAIYLESNQGESTIIDNCLIKNNKALENGSIIYTTTYEPDNDTNYGGNVLFTFCTMIDNEASDKDTFSFYDLLKKELSGNIELKGCLVIDDSSYVGSDSDYNYIANKEKAISEGVIREDDHTFIKNSKVNLKIEASIYSLWSSHLSEKKEQRRIGYQIIKVNKKSFPTLLVVICSIAIVIVIFLIWFIIFIKKKENTILQEKIINYDDYTFEDIKQKVEQIYKGILTKKEMIVATYLLYDNSRKEIAQKLFVSDETIKSHLSSIFKKTGVSSKIDFKKETEKKIFFNK